MKPLFYYLIASLTAVAGNLRAQSAAEDVKALETTYAEDRAAALRRVLARYADELEALEKSLAGAGDAAGAARVRLERDRVLPALGLPAVEADDADEFAVFEEAPPPVLPVVPSGAPGDLDAILKTLLPPAAAAATDGAEGKPAVPGAPGAGRGAKRVLRMSNAQLIGSFDPVYPYVYWTYGRTASWTLTDLPPGSYQLLLRYTCDEKSGGGGKLEAAFGSGKLEVKVPPTGGWKRRRDLVIGPFQITEPRVDLILKATPDSSYLMDLAVVAVQPAATKPVPGKP